MADNTTELAVTYQPAVIEFDTTDYRKRLVEILKPYQGALYDTTDAQGWRDAKRDAQYLGGLITAIDTRRKEIERANKAQIAGFSDECKQLVELIQGPRDAIKAQLDEGEQRRKDNLLAELDAVMHEYDPALYDSLGGAAEFIDPRWLNRSFGSEKAKGALRERIDDVNSELATLRGMVTDQYRDVAEREFFATCSLARAMIAVNEAKNLDLVRAKHSEESGCSEPEPAPAYNPDDVPPYDDAPVDEPAPVPAPVDGPCAWVMHIYSATKPQMDRIGAFAKSIGVDGEFQRA